VNGVDVFDDDRELSDTGLRQDKDFFRRDVFMCRRCCSITQLFSNRSTVVS
jgi:hypothetical protein